MLAGGLQAADAPVLGLLGCGRGTELAQHRQHWLGLRSKATPLLRPAPCDPQGHIASAFWG